MTAELSSRRMGQMPLFYGLNESECRQIAEIATVVGFNPGEAILKQGEESRVLFVLLEGMCEVVRTLSPGEGRAETVVLAALEPYQHFGDMSFFHPAPHSATIRAKTAVKLIRIQHGEYQDLVLEGVTAAYKLAYNCVHGLAERLRRMDQWVAELAGDRVVNSHDEPEWNRFREKLFQGLNL